MRRAHQWHHNVESGAARRDAGDTLRLAMPSGVLTTVGAAVRHGNAIWNAARDFFYRTARRLFQGYVYARPPQNRACGAMLN